MISNDAIHVQAKGREDGNVKGINTLEVDDYFCVMHDAWWCANPIIVMYKWPQPWQGTHEHAYEMDKPLV